MIALFLALQAAAAAPGAPAATVPMLGPLGRQALPARGCAAYLWSRADRRLVAVAGADPATLRIAPDGRAADLAREAGAAADDWGFAERTTYRSGDLSAALDMATVRRPDLADGGVVPDGTLTLSRGGGDAVVVPVAGLIGCRPAPNR